MDEMDRKILDLLREDARMSYVDIARRLGISEGTVRNRVEKMQSRGIIDRFTVKLGGESIARAFVMVKLSVDADIPQLVKGFPEDLEFFEIAGDHDLIVELRGENTLEINETVDAIRSLNGVISTKTYMVLNKPGL